MILSEPMHPGIQSCSVLSPQQLAAIKAYTSCQFTDINKCLRGQSTDMKKVAEYINNINSIFDLIQPTFVESSLDFVLYRGMYFDGMQNYKAGDIIENKGYVSTSSTSLISQRFMKNDKAKPAAPFCCLLEIRFFGNKSYKILKICQDSHHSDEDEYLLPSGCKFEIFKKEVVDNMFSSYTKYIAYYVPPAEGPGSLAGGALDNKKNNKSTFTVAKGVRIKLQKLGA
jgi:hypothetical protein